MIKSIFISRSIEDTPLLASFCQKNAVNLFAHSLIDFKSVPFNIKNIPEIVFFSSIRAANYFLAQQKIPKNTKIACIGETTARKLQKLGLQVDFIGVNSGDPDKVAKEFAHWVGNRNVLIPCSNVSNGSISKELMGEQLLEIVVYQTNPNPMIIALCDLYIFTSPSNIKSFLSLNSIPDNSTVIAWGKTSEKELKKNGISPKYTLVNATEEELIKTLSADLKQ